MSARVCGKAGKCRLSVGRTVLSTSRGLPRPARVNVEHCRRGAEVSRRPQTQQPSRAKD